MKQANSEKDLQGRLLAFYRRHRRWLEWSYWPLVMITQAIIAGTSVVMEYQRRGTPIAAWEPLSWELSSAITTLVGILLILWFDRRFPLDSPKLLKHAGAHAAFTLVFSLVHIVGMVAIREAVYSWMGRNYDFGNWSFELLYEYRKDALTYFGIVVTIYVYRFLASRLLGEASPISEGEGDEPADPSTERLLIKKLGKEFLLKVDQIEWIEAAGNYMNLHADGRVYPIRQTMAQLEKRLADRPFVRVHRSFLVNLDHIQTLTPLESGDATIEMSDGSSLRLSRRYRENLKNMLTSQP